MSYACQALLDISNVRARREEGGRTLTAPTHSAFSLYVKVRHSLRVSSLLHFCDCSCDCDSLRSCAYERWALARTASTQRSRIERPTPIIIQLRKETTTRHRRETKVAIHSRSLNNRAALIAVGAPRLVQHDYLSK